MEYKFCKDCIWCRRSFLDVLTFSYRFSKCGMTTGDGFLVDEGSDMDYCSIERREWEHWDSCGPKGKYWEAK